MPMLFSTLSRSVVRLLLAAALVSGLSVAHAARVPMTLEELVAVSDEIVAVRVLESHSHPYEQRTIVTTSKYQVLENFKGISKGEQEITYPGGKVGTLVMGVPDIPRLDKGEEA